MSEGSRMASIVGAPAVAIRIYRLRAPSGYSFLPPPGARRGRLRTLAGDNARARYRRSGPDPSDELARLGADRGGVRGRWSRARRARAPRRRWEAGRRPSPRRRRSRGASPRGQAWGPSMPAARMSAPTWRCAAWRVMGHSARMRPRGLAWARLTRCTSSSSCTRSSGTGTLRQCSRYGA